MTDNKKVASNEHKQNGGSKKEVKAEAREREKRKRVDTILETKKTITF